MIIDTKANPRVSVLMPVHNGARHLREAIESILNQKFENFEFIIIDDASTEEARRILKEYASSDYRIILIRNEKHLGITASLNVGLRCAKGEYVARMDGDDISLSDRISCQIDYLDLHSDVAVVGCWIQVIDANGGITGTRKNVIRDHADFLFSMLTCRNWFCHSSVMFRKSVVDQLGGYNENWDVAQDFELWVKMALAGFDARIVQKQLFLYRAHSGQLTVTQRAMQLTNRDRAYEHFLKSVLDDFTVEPMKLFLRKDESLWLWLDSPHRSRVLSRGVGLMLRNIKARIPMNNKTYKTLRSHMVKFAHYASVQAIVKSGRLVSIVFFIFCVISNAGLKFIWHGISYMLSFIGVLACLKEKRDVVMSENNQNGSQ